MGKVTVVLFALLAAASSALAQLPPDPSGALGPIFGTVVPPAVGTAENESAQDLSREDIRIDLAVDLANVEYEIVGILFGGGKVAADAIVDVHLEFRAVSTERVDEAIRSASGDANASLSGSFGFPADRTAITAEEIRVVGGGAVLEAFQAQQADATRSLVEATLPGLTMLSVDVEWTNTAPATYITGWTPPEGAPPPEGVVGATPQVDLREPPLVLDARARLSYLDRVSLGEVLSDALARKAAANGTEDDAETPEARLKREIRENSTSTFRDRSAFDVLGFPQLLSFGVPSGWRMNLTMTVPAGFTVEDANDELRVADDRRGIAYALDGSVRTLATENAGLVTLSNRFLVTATLLAVVLVAGYATRLPAEIAALALTARAYERRTGVRPPRREGRVRRWVTAWRRRT